jgi:hypothetical protein
MVEGNAGQGLYRTIVKRTYAEIMHEYNQNLNVLEISSQKIDFDTNTTNRNISFADFSDFVLETLQVRPEDCVSYGHAEFGFNNKELKFRAGVDISSYCRSYTFRGHTILVKRQGGRTVRVTFRDVPHFVLDEELRNIVETFGKAADDRVYYEPGDGRMKGLVNVNTRHIDMELGNMQMPNYFWLEGPNKGDSGARVSATYPRQERQCYNCLQMATACPGDGKGKVCGKELKTARASMDTYMSGLKQQFGFTTLKAQDSAEFPGLGGAARPVGPAPSAGASREEEQDNLIAELEEKLRMAEERERVADEREKDDLMLRTAVQEVEVRAAAVLEQKERERAEERKRDELEMRDAAEEYEKKLKEQQASALQQRALKEAELQAELAEERRLREEASASLLTANLTLQEVRESYRFGQFKIDHHFLDKIKNGEMTEEVLQDMANSAFLLEFKLSADGQDVIPPDYFLEGAEMLVSPGRLPEVAITKKDVLERIRLRLLEMHQVERQDSMPRKKPRTLSQSLHDTPVTRQRLNSYSGGRAADPEDVDLQEASPAPSTEVGSPGANEKEKLLQYGESGGEEEALFGDVSDLTNSAEDVTDPTNDSPAGNSLSC